MSLPVAPAPDILAAVVAFLQAAMGGPLASSTGFPQVYADYAPEINPDGSPVAQPYAVVFDGDERYSFEAQDPATGHYLHGFADGTARVVFYATAKADARALARAAALKMSDSQVDLESQDARTLTLFPARSDPVPLSQAGVGQPAVFARAVTFTYKQEFGA